MKKIFLTVAVAVMAAVGANAQSFEWGAKAGVNMAWQTEFSEPVGLGGLRMSTKGRTGFYAGVFVERMLGKRLGVQGELLYIPTGMSGKTGEISYGIETDYLALPVLAKVYVWRGLSVDLGPQFAYRLSVKGVGSSRNDDMGYWKKFDMAVAAGLSYKFTERSDISARYNAGLTKLDHHTDAKNASISLGVGYRF